VHRSDGRRSLGSKEIAICERILTAAGLKTHLHSFGTNIECDWGRVFAAVKLRHEALHTAGVRPASLFDLCDTLGVRFGREWPPLPLDEYNVKPYCMDFCSPGIRRRSGVDLTAKSCLRIEEAILKWQTQQT
jgi:hypothetical protein